MRNSIKHLFFTSFFLFAYIFAQALPTSIKGNAVEGKGMFIRLTTYTDRISFEEEILATSEIDSNANFELNFDISGIQEVFLKIGNQSFSFFAEAGKTYQLEINEIESSPKSALSEHKPLRVVWKNRNDLNEVLDNFNYTLSAFLEKNFIAIYKYRDTKLLLSFEQEIAEKLKNTTSLNEIEKVFFENYIRYQMADLKMASRTSSDLALGNSYFKDMPILYSHPNYMVFFRHYFNQYFLSGKRNINYDALIKIIQSGGNANKLLDYLSKDPLLEHARLREFVLLHALKEVYYSTDFKQEQVRALIKDIADHSAFTEHKKIASAVLDVLTRLQIGTQAPEIKLKSAEGLVKNLADYKESYVYLAFVSENCPACEIDLASIEQMAKKYKANIAFVEIFVNYTKEGLKKLTKQNYSSIHSFSFNNDYELLNKYNVRTFPTYLLLDREGKILLNQSKKPDENMMRYFDFLIKSDQEKAKKKDDLFR